MCDMFNLFVLVCFDKFSRNHVILRHFYYSVMYLTVYVRQSQWNHESNNYNIILQFWHQLQMWFGRQISVYMCFFFNSWVHLCFFDFVCKFKRCCFYAMLYLRIAHKNNECLVCLNWIQIIIASCNSVRTKRTLKGIHCKLHNTMRCACRIIRMWYSLNHVLPLSFYFIYSIFYSVFVLFFFYSDP